MTRDLIKTSRNLSQFTIPSFLIRPTEQPKKRIRKDTYRNIPMLSSPLISSQSVVSQIYLNNQPPNQDTSEISSTNLNTSLDFSNVNSLARLSDENNTEITTERNNLSSSQTERPNYNSLFAILSKYFTSASSLAVIISKIESLSIVGSLQFNDLITSITPSARPNQEVRLQIIRELRESGIVTFTEIRKNSFKLQKGPNFQ